ncbi:MAG: hypothetical protein DMG10_25100 [Acidobacteria bacterium]|nr:MAG: hypothetical protein DMG10_25100 [Acidobacteriota bacterium]
MRGAATKAMSDIVEERQQSRYAPFAAAPLWAAARRPAGFVARSSHTAPGIARRSRLASGPGGLQQNGKLFLREPLALNFLFMNQATPPGIHQPHEPMKNLFLSAESRRILEIDGRRSAIRYSLTTLERKPDGAWVVACDANMLTAKTWTLP